MKPQPTFGLHEINDDICKPRLKWVRKEVFLLGGSILFAWDKGKLVWCRRFDSMGLCDDDPEGRVEYD